MVIPMTQRPPLSAKRNANSKIQYYYIAIAALALAVIVLLIVTIIGNYKLSESNRQKDELSQKGEQLELTIGDLNAEKSRLEAERIKLGEEISALTSKLDEMNSDVKFLEGLLQNASDAHSTEALNLREQITKMKSDIQALELDIERYQKVHDVDIRAQSNLIGEIITYIETMSPYVRMVDSDKTEDKASSGKNTEPVYKWVAVADLIEEEIAKAKEAEEDIFYTEDELKERGMTAKDYENYLSDLMRPRVLAREDITYPSISICYQDILTGYSFKYNADVVYDAASVVKAPYILSVLQAIDSDEKKFFEKVENGFEPEMIDTDGDEIPDTIKIEYSDPSFDLSETVVYTKDEMFREGSGKIKDMEDGTEFSYLDFVNYTLLYSDNVAYQALRARFGYDNFYKLASKLGVKSVLKGGNSMSAADAVKLFAEIYKFTEESEKYGTVMKEAMLKGNHTVIVPYGVYPTKTMHKYGWDTNAYHDVGIVLYADRPLIISVFSDLDNGGTEVNAFLSGIVGKLFKLHKNFY